jgi:hypothetical protein
MDLGVLGAHNDIPREPRAEGGGSSTLAAAFGGASGVFAPPAAGAGAFGTSRHQPEKLRALLLLRLPLERGGVFAAAGAGGNRCLGRIWSRCSGGLDVGLAGAAGSLAVADGFDAAGFCPAAAVFMLAV